MVVLTRISPTQKCVACRITACICAHCSGACSPSGTEAQAEWADGAPACDIHGLSASVIGRLALADVGLRSIPSQECHVPCMPRRSIGDTGDHTTLYRIPIVSALVMSIFVLAKAVELR